MSESMLFKLVIVVPFKLLDDVAFDFWFELVTKTATEPTLMEGIFRRLDNLISMGGSL
jgi:hypothetical protein